MAAMAMSAQATPVREIYFDALGAALVRTDEVDWIGGRAGVKMLRISKETGWSAALVKGCAGQVNPSHTHVGPACFYVLEGGFDYRGGSARAGDWVYEPTGAVHEATSHPLDTLYLANVYGPVAFHRPDGSISGILDGRWMQALADRAGQRQS